MQGSVDMTGQPACRCVGVFLVDDVPYPFDIPVTACADGALRADFSRALLPPMWRLADLDAYRDRASLVNVTMNASTAGACAGSSARTSA